MTWYEDEVKRVEQIKATLPYPVKTVFYGSSSIRLWTTLYQDFASFYPVNLGFGGSTLAACVWFFERLLSAYQPATIVFYAGDNDLGDGRNPEEVAISLRQLIAIVKQKFPGVSFYFISIKISLARWNIRDRIKYTNQLAKEIIDQSGPGFHYIDIVPAMTDPTTLPNAHLFEEDGLHLSSEGYEVWKAAVLEALKKP